MYKIVKYLDKNYCLIQFEGYHQLLKRRISEAKSGNVKNTFKPIVYNIGYFGYNNIKDSPPKTKKYKRIYYIWKDMLRRCYSDNGSYVKKRITVDSRWHSFKEFYEWCISEKSNYRDDFHLDKDILYGMNKIYSPDRCIFVPKYINNLLVLSNEFNNGITKSNDSNSESYKVFITHKKIYLGRYTTKEEAIAVYSYAKELYIRETSLKSFNKSEIDLKTFNALFRYTFIPVNIDDEINLNLINKYKLKMFTDNTKYIYLKRFIEDIQSSEVIES